MKMKKKYFSTSFVFLSIAVIITALSGCWEFPAKYYDIYVQSNPGQPLAAFIIYHKDTIRTTYGPEETPWPSTQPYFTWIRVQPRSEKIADKKYVVHYDSIIENTGPLYNEWEYQPTTEMGTNYYKVLADFDDLGGEGHVYLNSAPDSEGIKLTIVPNIGSSFPLPVEKYAAMYLKVPYVYGYHKDEDGHIVGKCYYSGFRGIDCSGLASYAYNDAYFEGIDVCNTNAEMLYEKYHISGATYDDKQPGDMIFLDMDGNGTADHVGIVCTVATNKVIHATSENIVDIDCWSSNHPRSVVYENLSYRSYWRNNFLGIGRKQ